MARGMVWLAAGALGALLLTAPPLHNVPIATSAAPPPASGGAARPDPCAVLSGADVSAAFHLPVRCGAVYQVDGRLFANTLIVRQQVSGIRDVRGFVRMACTGGGRAQSLRGIGTAAGYFVGTSGPRRGTAGFVVADYTGGEMHGIYLTVTRPTKADRKAASIRLARTVAARL